MSLYDLVGPFRGPCGLCGDPDARHRITDAVAELVRAGDGPVDVAADYGLSVEAVERIAAEAPHLCPVCEGSGQRVAPLPEGDLIRPSARCHHCQGQGHTWRTTAMRPTSGGPVNQGEPMTRQELLHLLREACPVPRVDWDAVADAVIAAGFPVDPEPVTIVIPGDVAAEYASLEAAGPAAGAISRACREALGMEP